MAEDKTCNLVHGTPFVQDVRGTNADDCIVGTQGNNFIEGKDGNDHILGVRGENLILAGAGDDYVDHGDGWKGRVVLGEGNDTLFVDVKGWTGVTLVDFNPAEDQIQAANLRDNVDLSDVSQVLKEAGITLENHDQVIGQLKAEITPHQNAENLVTISGI